MWARRTATLMKYNYIATNGFPIITNNRFLENILTLSFTFGKVFSKKLLTLQPEYIHLQLTLLGQFALRGRTVQSYRRKQQSFQKL